MPAPAALTVDRASDVRIERAAEQVGPLLVRGLTISQIAKELGISRSVAGRDAQLCQNYWKERIAQAGEEWRHKAVQQYEFVLKELHEQWQLAKEGRKTVKRAPDGTETIKVLPADLKALSAIVATTKELTTLLGLRQADTVQQVSIDSTTVNALAPMSSDDYLKMIASGGGLPTTAAPAHHTTAPPSAAEQVVDVQPMEDLGPQEPAQGPQEQLDPELLAAAAHPPAGPSVAPDLDAQDLDEQDLDAQDLGGSDEPSRSAAPPAPAAAIQPAIQPALPQEAPGPAPAPAAALSVPVTLPGLARRLARIRGR